MRRAIRTARARGFTHLPASAKRTPSVMRHIAGRVQRDRPDHRSRGTAPAQAG
ncbi:MAG TPA: hypothetical protein VMU34_15475 [Mycobacterium sp.]|nr:hypothetical protein [Mycobacterium sp.]